MKLFSRFSRFSRLSRFSRFVFGAALGSFLAAANPAFSQNWIRHPLLSAGGTNWIITAIACSADGGTIVAAAYNGPVWVSTDLGATWQVTSLAYNSWSGVTCSADGRKMTAVSGEFNTITWNTFTIYTSSDSGASWTPRSSPTAPDIVNAFSGVAGSADGTRLVALVSAKYDPTHPTNTVPWDGGIYLSTDSGASWQVGGTGGTNNFSWAAVASSADGNTLAGLSVTNQRPPTPPFRVLLLSRDAGASWNRANLPKFFLTSIAISADGSKLVVGATDTGGTTGDHLFTSADSGATWTDQAGAPQGKFGGLFWKSVASSADGTKLVLGSNGGGLYTSADSGVTWQQNFPGAWNAVASSADGRELVALNNDIIYTLQPPLFAKISATPQRVHTGDSIQVVVTVINNDTKSVTNVSLAGVITVAGSGGVSPAGSAGPTLMALLAPGATASFTNLYTATNYGTVNFTASATCTGVGGVVTSPLTTSGNVTIVPNGDLLIKRALDPPNNYAGAGVFQTIPIPPQIKTNFVVNTSDISTFQVQIQNNDLSTQTFTLYLNSSGNPVWKQTFLLSGADVTAQLETPNGLTLPAMAPNSSLVLTVSAQDTNAAPGDLNGAVITLGLASDPTVTLDAVEAVTQTIPDGDLLIKRDAGRSNLEQDFRLAWRSGITRGL
jgi:hypothetical protein